MKHLLRALFVVIGAALVVGPGVALAVTPTPSAPAPATGTPSVEPTATPTIQVIEMRFDDVDAFHWPAVEGVAAYRLSGHVSYLRVNAADPFCTPPVVHDNATISVDVRLGSEATSYRVPLPAIETPDRWFIYDFEMELDGLDGEARAIAGTRLGYISETLCGRAPTPLPEAITVGSCEIPAGFVEVTTPAAVEHGQRVFLDPTGVTRIYVRRDGSCVFLQLAVAPIPEFAPDGPLGTSGFASDPPPPGLALPSTGTGGPNASRVTAALALFAVAGLAGLATVLGGVRRSRGSGSHGQH